MSASCLLVITVLLPIRVSEMRAFLGRHNFAYLPPAECKTSCHPALWSPHTALMDPLIQQDFISLIIFVVSLMLRR